MNILFLSLVDFHSFEERNIYTDLLREFIRHGHKVHAISPVERRRHERTHLLEFNGNTILKLRIGNIQKTHWIEKGLSTLALEPLLIRGIQTHYSHIKFDLVLYATPPVTFAQAIQFIQKRDGAKTYLLLKDIFPQNSVDLGMMRPHGLKGGLYRYFRWREKALYRASDRIGCMSQANVDYILKHNQDIPVSKVEICPNCVEPVDERLNPEEKRKLRVTYGLPLEKKIFVYGGNLGKPQDIPWMVTCLRACAHIQSAYFLIAGSGTDRHYLEKYIQTDHPPHVQLLEWMPKDEYDAMIACCDVGLIFLDHRFTIPNFPSRLLSYMQGGLPVLACTDGQTDVGEIIVQNGFGWWCESQKDKLHDFIALVENICAMEDFSDMIQREWAYLNKEYSSTHVYELIMNSLAT